ncbi:OmpA family protein [Streptomyces sp. RB6PN25]|uniref:OmpA family protein n=1 Tax=Streptomyces humicola TaxID=2953240 RepID=A0ABT1PX69_9ACTN|nr:OmpA family protein [Streptomyces humicola]MCQ4082262.1 OmpA family protein [Streptomyces humicola]
MPHTPLRTAAVAASAVLALALATDARADGSSSPSPLPSATPSAPTPIDTSSPALKLPQGDTLAPPKVLDITTVVSDSDNAETESQSNTEITYALEADVLFSKDSYQLNPAALDRINAIATDINNRHVTGAIRVFGFTDNLGTVEHGQVLAKERANAVYQALAPQITGGNTFDVRGYGNQYYVADNSTEAGRAQNRRVEISFTPPSTSP